MRSKNFQSDILKKSKEAKKEMLTKAKALRKKTTNKNNLSSPKTNKKNHKISITPLNINNDECSDLKSCSNFALIHNETDSLKKIELVKANNQYVKTSSILLQAKKERDIYLVFSWPHGFHWPGLMQVICSKFIAWHSSEKTLKIVMYPSNQRNITRYKHVFDNIQEHRQVELDKINNSNNEHAFNTRSNAILASGSIINDNEMEDWEKLVSLSSLFPNFIYDKTQKWKHISNSFIQEIYKSLWKKGKSKHRELIDEYKNKMASPDDCDTGLYRIPKKHTFSQCRTILKEEHKKFDVSLIDARSYNLRNQKGWKHNIVKIINDHLDSTYPGLIIMMDDIRTYKSIKYEIEKSLLNKKELSKKIYKYENLNRTDEIWKNTSSSKEPLFFSKIDFNCHSNTTFHDIEKMIKLSSTLEKDDKQAANLIRMMSGFVRSIIDSPVTQKDEMDWVNRVTENWASEEKFYFASKIIWGPYKASLLNSIGEKLINHSCVKEALKIADAIIEKTKESTPLEAALLEAVKDAVNAKKETIVIIKSHRLIKVFSEICSDIIGESFETYIKVIGLNDFKKHIDAPNLIIAGSGEKLIPDLLLNPTIASHITIVTDLYSAKRIYMDMIELKKINSFQCIYPRLDLIISKIEPLVKSTKAIGNISHDFIDENLYHVVDDTRWSGINKPYAVLYLSGYGGIPVGENTTILKESFLPKTTFLGVKAKEVNEGERILLFSDSLKEQLTDFIKVSFSKTTELGFKILDGFFSSNKIYLAENFSLNTRKKRAEKVLQKIQKINLEGSKNISLEMVQAWIKCIEEYDNKDTDIHTRFAQKKENFYLFCEALEIPQHSIEMYWASGVHTVRVGKILSGRYILTILKSLLCDETLAREYGLDLKNYEKFCSLAKESLFTVNMIEVLEEGETNA